MGLARVGLVGCVAVAGWVAPRAADACSAPPPYSGPTQRTAYPLPTADAPTNTKIRITYDALIDSPAARDVVVRPVGGEPIEVVSDFSYDRPIGVTVIVEPVEPLAANTDYEVLDRIDVPCEFDGTEGSCERTDHEVIGVFHTGDGADESPPIFEGFDVFDTLGRQTCDNDGCCGPYYIVTGEIGWSSASDDTPLDQIRYEVFDTSDRRVLTFVDSQRASVAYCCDCANPEAIDWSGTHVVVDRSLRVRAVDLAGNSDGNRNVVTWAEPCVPGGNDAGPEPGEDAGCGCAVSARSSGARGAVWFALLVVVALGTKRRRARGGWTFPGGAM